jgi:hypothetical protein
MNSKIQNSLSFITFIDYSLGSNNIRQLRRVRRDLDGAFWEEDVIGGDAEGVGACLHVLQVVGTCGVSRCRSHAIDKHRRLGDASALIKQKKIIIKISALHKHGKEKEKKQ